MISPATYKVFFSAAQAGAESNYLSKLFEVYGALTEESFLIHPARVALLKGIITHSGQLREIDVGVHISPKTLFDKFLFGIVDLTTGSGQHLGTLSEEELHVFLCNRNWWELIVLAIKKHPPHEVLRESSFLDMLIQTSPIAYDNVCDLVLVLKDLGSADQLDAGLRMLKNLVLLQEVDIASHIIWLSQNTSAATAIKFTNTVMFRDTFPKSEKDKLIEFFYQNEAWSQLKTFCNLRILLDDEGTQEPDNDTAHYLSYLILANLKEGAATWAGALYMEAWKDQYGPFPFPLAFLEHLHIIPESDPLLRRLSRSYSTAKLSTLAEGNWRFSIFQAITLKESRRYSESYELWDTLLANHSDDFPLLRLAGFYHVTGQQQRRVDHITRRLKDCPHQQASFYAELFDLLTKKYPAKKVIEFTLANNLHKRDTDPLFVELRERFLDLLRKTGRPEDEILYTQLKQDGALSDLSMKDRFYFEYLGKLRSASEEGIEEIFVDAFSSLLSLDLDNYQLKTLYQVFRRAEERNLFARDEDGEYQLQLRQVKRVFTWLLYLKVEKLPNVNLDNIDFGNIENYLPR